jgi:hypothetical protein
MFRFSGIIEGGGGGLMVVVELVVISFLVVLIVSTFLSTGPNGGRELMLIMLCMLCQSLVGEIERGEIKDTQLWIIDNERR